MFISVSSWLSPHLTFSFDTLLGIIISCWRLFSSTRSLFMAKATPILLEYCPLVIILILGTTASIWAVSASVVLASCIAKIAILLVLMILAILGHFELWVLLFFPLIFQDTSMIPFFFPSFDWNCFLVLSCSSMFISSGSVISVDWSGSLQKGFVLSWFELSCLWLDSMVSDSVGVAVVFSVSVGLILSGVVIWFLRWLVSLL